MPLTAIVLAAGEGTRMKSHHPKIVHKLLDKPLVWWSVNAAITAGADRIIVVVGNHADEVKSALSCFPNLEYVAQTKRLGTGHAVKVVKDALGGFKGPVVVINGDASLLRAQSILDLVAETKAHHNACTVLTMTPPDPTGYGRVISSNGQVTAIVEHKDATPEQREQERECNVGVYCFCGGRLTASIDLLGNDNVQGEYYLTDMVGLYVSQGEPVAAVHVDDYKEALGVNSRSELAVATRIMQERINEHWMSQGVTMLDPTSVWIGPEVTLGVVDETVAINAQVDDFATCGPRAYLRPGTHLMPHAKAGTHVEIKNSTIGEGSKVPHLSYIGDTTMGSGVNIGAGSITCNYDGYHKFKTNIGNNVFVGSDTMMVAPVSIGDGALVGASSCITRDVPADALALERSEQKIVEGYAAQRRHKLEKED